MIFFPRLLGLSWDVKRTPIFNTTIQEGTNPGKEVRVSFTAQPRWRFECAFDVIRDREQDPVTGYTELQLILGFVQSRAGDFDSFLLNLSDLTQNPNDSLVVGSILGTADGANKNFQTVRLYGGFSEECYAPQDVSVYDNGNLVDPANYTITNGIVSFTTAPTAAHVITASFTFVYVVRFAIYDTSGAELTFNNSYYKVHDLQQVVMLSLKP